MTKSHGLGERLYVAGVDLSGDTGELPTCARPHPTQDATGIDKLAFERLSLRRDGELTWRAWWNPTGAHVVLSALPTADVPITYAHRAALGASAASMVAKQVNYDGNRGDDGSLSLNLQALANGYGLEWGKLLTAGAETVESGTPNTADALDGGAGTSFGLQAYLHVLAFDGTDVTLSIQHSDDDGDTDPYTDLTGGTFAAVTSAPISQRLQTDRDEAVKRYLRLAAATASGFTSVTFVVAVVRNKAEVIF